MDTLNPMKKVAPLAAACGVTPYAVYGWIEQARVRAVRTPSGRLMIPDHEYDRVVRLIRDQATLPN